MKCTVLEAFPFAEDGLTTKEVQPGDPIDVPDDILEGLIDAGLVETNHGDETLLVEGTLSEAGLIATGAAIGGDQIKVGSVTHETTTDPATYGLPEKTPEEVAEEAATEELDQLRASYEEVTGNKANGRWKAETIRQKILEASA